MKKPAKNRAVKKKKIVQTFPNFLSKEDWDTSFFEYLQRPNWGYGHTSARNRPSVHSAPQYWEMILDDDDFFVEHVFNKIKEVTGDDLVLTKVYAGGNTFGTSGDVHVDHSKDHHRTFLYHASPDVWKPMWGGKTIFYPEGRDPIYKEFVPNQGLYFKANIPHMGEPTTKFFEGLRICVAFKMVLASVEPNK